MVILCPLHLQTTHIETPKAIPSIIKKMYIQRMTDVRRN